jgi:hypothetical protein
MARYLVKHRDNLTFMFIYKTLSSLEFPPFLHFLASVLMANQILMHTTIYIRMFRYFATA